MSLLPNDTRTPYGGLFQHLTIYRHVMEIGAGDRYSSEALPIALNGQARKVTLYEPNILLASDLGLYLDGCRPPSVDIRLHQMAVASATWGQLDFYHMGYASWALGAPSFMRTSIEPEGLDYLGPLVRKVTGVEAGKVVTEDVDLLILTCNGCERYCLESMEQHNRWPQEIRTAHYIHNHAQSEEAGHIWRMLSQRGYQATVTAQNQHRTFARLTWNAL